MQIDLAELFVSILALCSQLLAMSAFVSLLCLGIQRRWRASIRLIGLTVVTLITAVIGFFMVAADCGGLHGGCSGHRYGVLGIMGLLLWFGSVPAYLGVLIWVWRRG